MAKTWSGGWGNSDYAATNKYHGAFGSSRFAYANGAFNEEPSQAKVAFDGTYSKLGCQIGTNTLVNDATMYFRINAANGNQAVTVPAGVTGWFEDAVHTDAVLDGDLVNMRFEAPSSGGGSAYVNGYGVVFEADSGTHHLHTGGTNSTDGWVDSSNSYTGYWNPWTGGDKTGLPSSPSTVEMKVGTAGTLSNFGLRVSTNPSANDITANFYINGAVGNQTITIPAGTTGIFEDTANSDAIADGDMISAQMVFGASTGFYFRVRIAWMDFEPDTEGYDIWTYSANSVFESSTKYINLFGRLDTDATEAKMQYEAPFDMTLSMLRVQVSSSSSSGGSVTLRVNGVDTALSAAWASGTGWKEDNTHSVDVTAGDLISLVMPSSTGPGNLIDRISISVNENAPPPPSGVRRRNVFIMGG